MNGQTLGRYRVLEKLGEGGMGVVYLAEDTALRREVALKLLPPEVSENQERLQRFQREAETLAGLNHPNIVTIYSVEEVDGQHFFTMEYVKGETLFEVTPRRGLSLTRFFDLAIPLAEAVSAAHESGVIHRDLKPANIMLTDGGQLKVLDFGLAKPPPLEAAAVDTRAPTHALTGEHQILGTAAYMSPEQIRGKDLDSRTDIFSLGIILYQLAAGRRPFKGETSADFASAILRDTPSPVDLVKTGLPHHLGRIIRHCLDKDPDRRYQSAKDLRNDLDDLRLELTTDGEARPSGAPKRNPWWQPAVWLSLFLGLVAAGLYLVLGPQPGSENRGPPPAGPSAVHKLLDQAQLHELRGDTRENLTAAEERYRRALAMEPDNPRIKACLAALLARLQIQYPEPERGAEIARLAEDALRSEPDLAPAHVALGRLAMLEGDTEAAVEAARRAQRSAPEHYSGSALLGEALIAQERVDEGLLELRHGVDLAGSDMGARLTLARELMHLGRYNEAAVEYEEVLEYVPDSPNALNNLGIVYARTGRDADAIPMFTRLLRLQDDEAAALNLGVIYFNLGRFDAAIGAFERAHEIAPDKPLALHNLGDTYEAKGESESAAQWFEEAIGSYTRALEAGGPDARRLGRRAVCAAKLGRFDEALQDIEAALELSPQNAGRLFNSAQVHALAGNRQQVLRHTRLAIEAGYPRQEFRRDICFRELQDDTGFLGLLEGTAGL